MLNVDACFGLARLSAYRRYGFLFKGQNAAMSNRIWLAIPQSRAQVLEPAAAVGGQSALECANHTRAAITPAAE